MGSSFKIGFSTVWKCNSMLTQQLYANTPITVWNKYTLIFTAVAQTVKGVSFNLVITCSFTVISVNNCTNSSSPCMTLNNLINISLSPCSSSYKRRTSSHIWESRLVLFGQNARALQEEVKDEKFRALWQEATGVKLTMPFQFQLHLMPLWVCSFVITLIISRLQAPFAMSPIFFYFHFLFSLSLTF